MTEPLPLPTKHVYIEILGGGEDGLTLDSQSENPAERNLAEMLTVSTQNGKIGHGMKGQSLSNIRAMIEGRISMMEAVRSGQINPAVVHHYYVTDRIEEESEILVRMRYEMRHVPLKEKPKTE